MLQPRSNTLAVDFNPLEKLMLCLQQEYFGDFWWLAETVKCFLSSCLAKRVNVNMKARRKGRTIRDSEITKLYLYLRSNCAALWWLP